MAAQRTVGKGREPAAEMLKAPLAEIEYREGHFSVAGTDLVIDLAVRQAAQHISVDSTCAVAGRTCPNGCHICDVEFDPATGAVEIVTYASVNNVGRVISPAIVRRQIDGCAVQGIGYALCVRIVYYLDSGELLSASFMDYALPRADCFTGFKIQFDTTTPAATTS